ncbi:hypothetical protein ACFX19_006705 [Malus domestica]
MKKLGRGTEDLIPTNLTISSFSGAITKTHGILPLEVDLGSKQTMLAFFVVDCTSTYGALLGRDWIHQSLAIPSTLHQQVAVYHEAGAEGPGANENGRPTKVTAQKLLEQGMLLTREELLVYGEGRRQENELLDREEQEWQVRASTSQDESEEESCQEELERAIQMAECI